MEIRGGGDPFSEVLRVTRSCGMHPHPPSLRSGPSPAGGRGGVGNKSLLGNKSIM